MDNRLGWDLSRVGVLCSWVGLRDSWAIYMGLVFVVGSGYNRGASCYPLAAPRADFAACTRAHGQILLPISASVESGIRG
jgi:hypothetical protein